MKITKIASVQVEIWKEDTMVGRALFSDEEVRHFSATPIFPAGIALSDPDLVRLGLDKDDQITIAVN